MGKSVIAGIVLVLIIAVVGAGVYLMQNIDGMVKGMIEEVGSETTGSDVRVAAVEIDLGAGSARINGLTVANPPGFSDEPLLTLDTIDVAIDTSSLTGDVYVINRIDVTGIRVLAEQQGTGTNVQALMDAMDEAPSDGAGNGGADAAEPLFSIGQINFANGSMELRSPELGTRELGLDALHLRDLGSRDNGLTAEQISTEITDQVMDQVKEAIRDAIKAYAREEAESKLKEKLGDLFNR